MSSRCSVVARLHGGAGGVCFAAGADSLVAVTSAAAGEVITLDAAGGSGDDGGDAQVRSSVGGAPRCVACYAEGNLYVCDASRKCVLSVVAAASAAATAGGAAASGADRIVVVRDYEGVALQGPSAAAVDSKGRLFFCDDGDSSLMRPTGSLFVIASGRTGHILKPVAYGCLAQPSGVAVSDDGSTVCAHTPNTHTHTRTFPLPSRCL
jgi:sugar lactone lactonase YvrE